MKKKNNPRLMLFLRNRILKPLLAIILTLVILSGVMLTLIQIPFFQLAIAKKISALYDIELLSLKMEMKPEADSISFAFSDIRGRSFDVSSAFDCMRLNLNLSYSSIMSGSFYPQLIEVTGPRVKIVKHDESSESADGLKAVITSVYSFLGSNLPETLKSFSIKKGAISLNETSIEDLSLNLVKNLLDIKKADFSLGFNLIDRKDKIPFRSYGDFLYDDIGLATATFDLSLANLPLAIMPWPASFKGTAGKMSSKGVKLNWRRGGSINASGMVILPEAGFILDAYNELKSINLSGTETRFDVEILKNAVDIRNFQINGNDFQLDASCFIPFDEAAKGMSLSVRSSMMPMQRFKALFPAPVTPTWIGTRLLPLFSGGRAKLNHLLIEGSFARVSGMDNKENASSLFLDIDLDEIDIDDFGGGLKSKKVSANVLLKNGRLTISDVNGSIGDSILKSGLYDYEDIYADESLENWYLSGRFLLSDLHIIAMSGISPPMVKEIVSEISKASGSIDGDFSFSYHPSWKNIGITGGRIISKKASFVLPMVAYPVDLQKMDVSFDENGVAKLNLSGSWGGSSGEVRGSADIFKGDLNLNGSALIDAGEVSSIIMAGDGKRRRISLKGKQQTDFNLSADAWRVKLASLSMLEGLTGGFGEFILPEMKKNSLLKLDIEQSRRKEWKINHLELSLDKGSLGLSAPYGFGSFSEISFSLNEFDVEKLGLYNAGNGLSFSGILNGDILIKPTGDTFTYPGVFGELKVSDAGIEMTRLPLENRGTGKIIFSGQRLYTDELKIGIGDSFLSVFADLRGWNGLKGEVAIRSKHLAIPAFGDDNASDELLPVFESEFAKNSDLKVNIDIESGLYRKNMKFGPAQATCLLNKGLFDIKNGKIVIPGGEIRFRLLQSETDRSSASARAYINLDQQSMRDIASNIDAEEYISVLDNAVLSSDAYLYCSGRNIEEMLSSLGGYVSLKLEDGIVKKSSVIFTILGVLNMEKFLHERPDGVPKEGFYFQSLDAGFKIKDGLLTTNDLKIISPIINIGAAGSINLNNRLIDLDVVAAPLVTIDSFVSNLPFLGYILTGTDRALLSYYFKVKGPLTSPETRYVPLKKIPESLIGYLKRIFMTPSRIPEEFKDMKDFILNKE